jgi:hypothetical protein
MNSRNFGLDLGAETRGEMISRLVVLKLLITLVTHILSYPF